MDTLQQFVNKEEEEAVGILSRNQQNHIIERIPKHTDAERAEFAKQVLHFNNNYPGGIENYVTTARKMLKEAQNEVNPFDDFIPSVPKGERVDFYSQDIVELEKIGMDQVRFTGFVLVAGGLGERLGYKGIKIGIPIDLVTRTTYLQYYIEYILAFQEKSNAPKPLPLAIMTSDDTHGLTVKLLEENNYFGMRREQVTIMKQEKVPALSDSDARIAMTGDKLWIESKPHGHGDVHTLLHMNKIVDKWENEGFKWVVFFQDTNALVFRCIPSMLAVSKKNNFEVNSATVPRKPGEAVGAICQLTSPDGSKNLTLNVEYNLLDGFLKKHGGEPVDKHGNSLYPGNINTLVFSLKEYRSVLKQTQGLVAEFINPKYESADKTKFKSSTRLESLMQDYPKLLPASAKVGFTTFDRQFVFSACKNDLKSAAQKFAQGLAPECGSSCEQAFYQLNAEILRIAGATVDKPAKDHAKTYAGITVNMGPYIVLKPSFGVTIDEIRSKLRGTVHITSRSTLILEGKVNLADVEIDGSYHLAGALSIANQEFTASGKSNFITLEEVKIEEHTPDYLKIRAYDIRNDERILKIVPRK